MIVSHRRNVAWSRFCAVCHTASFRCVIETMLDDADEGVILITAFDGNWDGRNGSPAAEAVMKPYLSSADIEKTHDHIVAAIDDLGGQGLDLGTAIERALEAARDVIVESQNFARLLIRSPVDVEVEQKQRLLMLMRSIETKTGSFPVNVVNGKPAIASALLMEFQKPYNAELQALLSQWL